jgi:hypothetical protein
VSDGIANITSIPVMKKLGSHFTYDSHNDFWTVTKGDITVIFCEDEQWLPYIDLKDKDQGVIFVQTVRESYKGYTKQEAKKAITAREAPTMLDCLSERYLEVLVRSKELDGMPAAPHDFRNAIAVFSGHDIAGVQGKTTRQASPERVIPDYVAIPRNV